MRSTFKDHTKSRSLYRSPQLFTSMKTRTEVEENYWTATSVMTTAHNIPLSPTLELKLFVLKYGKGLKHIRESICIFYVQISVVCAKHVLCAGNSCPIIWILCAEHEFFIHGTSVLSSKMWIEHGNRFPGVSNITLKSLYLTGKIPP